MNCDGELKQIVGGAVVDSLENPTRLLAARRSAPPELAGLWEFAGGKVEPGESCPDALRRELLEELGITVRLGAELAGPMNQGWPLNGKAAMRVWQAEIVHGVPEPLEDHDELRWIGRDRPDELCGLGWIPADLPIVHGLMAVFGWTLPPGP